MSNTHFLPKSLFEYLLADDDYLEKENYLFYYRLRLIIILGQPFSVIRIQISNFV
jgi:hypothetical protein